MESNEIKGNLKEITERIDGAVISCGRKPGSVSLLAVSKTKPADMIHKAIEAGVRDFGENYVQELSGKMDAIGCEKARWHMIGHLQTNKVKYIVGRVCLIHSVDSLRLAGAISREAVKKDVCQDILIEVNIGEEETKTGVCKAEAAELVRAAAELPGLHIRGLMCMPPLDGLEDSRMYFRKLRELRDSIRDADIPGVDMDILSMGTTSDFEEAIREGSTMVRVGTAIFGRREYMTR